MNTNKQLKRIKIETFIWYIYIFILLFNIYSNYLEELAIKNNDKKCRKKFRKINEGVFLIVLIIYIYFLYINYENILNINNMNDKQKHISYISMFVSILFVLAGFLSLYLAFKNDEFDQEIGLI